MKKNESDALKYNKGAHNELRQGFNDLGTWNTMIGGH